MVSGQVAFSWHYTTSVLGIHLCELTLVFFSDCMDMTCIFQRWKDFLLVSYFYFWAKPFSFWAKRCGRNSLWAKLDIFDACIQTLSEAFVLRTYIYVLGRCVTELGTYIHVYVLGRQGVNYFRGIHANNPC